MRYRNNRMSKYSRVTSYNYYRQSDSSNDDFAVGAFVEGGPLAPDIRGLVLFEPVIGGSQVFAIFYGLPMFQPASNGSAPIGPFGFHLHEFGDCSVGDNNSPFEGAGGHWNPTNQPHGNHAGDFPVIFSNDGYANISYFTNKFRPEEVLGKAVIIHQNPDDYRSQPSGDAGKRLACGIVEYISIDEWVD